MRVLWLLEKISNHQQFFRENKDQKLKVIFEQLVDYLVSSDSSTLTLKEFPSKYQCIRTLYKYTKQICIREIYADK
jgi:uncharacterized membrane protein